MQIFWIEFDALERTFVVGQLNVILLTCKKVHMKQIRESKFYDNLKKSSLYVNSNI